MINEHSGDVLKIDRGIIVHGCNAHGVMGSGIAAQIRKKWPKCYAVYRKEYERAGLKLGDVIYYKVHDRLLIANAITQQDFGADQNVVYVSYDAVDAAFSKILTVARWLELPVHFPLIGCGLANGNWGIVSKIIDENIPDELGKHLWLLPTATKAANDTGAEQHVRHHSRIAA